MQLNLVNNSKTLQIHRHRGHVPLYKHEIPGTSDNRKISWLSVVCRPQNRQGPFVVFQIQTHFSNRYTLKPIKGRSYGSTFSHTNRLGRRVRFVSEEILEGVNGAKRCGCLSNTPSGYAVHYYVAGFVDSFVLVERKVERFESLVVVVVVRGSGWITVEKGNENHDEEDSVVDGESHERR